MHVEARHLLTDSPEPGFRGRPARLALVSRDETPTPRQSGTLQMAPLWAAQARVLAARLQAERDRCKVLRLANRALSAKRRAEECIAFARAFEGWAIVEPAPPARAGLAREWKEHEQLSEDWLRGIHRPKSR